MAITIRGFGWDANNVDHLLQAHPNLDLVMLEEIVRRAERYTKHGPDRFGKMVYSATGQGWRVYFNIKRGQLVRIFSVRKV